MLARRTVLSAVIKRIRLAALASSSRYDNPARLAHHRHMDRKAHDLPRQVFPQGGRDPGTKAEAEAAASNHDSRRRRATHAARSHASPMPATLVAAPMPSCTSPRRRAARPPDWAVYLFPSCRGAHAAWPTRPVGQTLEFIPIYNLMGPGSFAHDGTEPRIVRPQDPAEQTDSYSGKKKGCYPATQSPLKLRIVPRPVANHLKRQGPIQHAHLPATGRRRRMARRDCHSRDLRENRATHPGAADIYMTVGAVHCI
jgi:hypothetical protein